MTVLTYVVKYRGGASAYGLKYLDIEVDNATASDTVTITDFTTIKDTVCVRLDTGVAVDCTEATNVITIGAGPSSTPLAIKVTGW